MVVMELFANTSRYLVKIEVNSNLTANFIKHDKFNIKDTDVKVIEADSFNELRDKASYEMYSVSKQSSWHYTPIDRETYNRILNRIGEDAEW